MTTNHWKNAYITSAPGITWATWLNEQREWADQTFGPGLRTQGIRDHMEKEWVELLENPLDLEEAIDIVFLAQDLATRIAKALYGPDFAVEVTRAYAAKLWKNTQERTWPDWRTADPNKAIEHVRTPEELAGKAA